MRLPEILEKGAIPGEHSTIGDKGKFMNSWRAICTAFVFAAILLTAGVAQDSKPTSPKANAAAANSNRKECSGMYTFLKDGEFVQISVEDEGRVTGFISRYGEGESDKGAFLDQYFRSAKLEGSHLIFVTETLHAVWFEFDGKVERGEGKNPGDDAYYVLKGMLTSNSSDAQKKVTSHSEEVVFKMFPAEASPTPAARN